MGIAGIATHMIKELRVFRRCNKNDLEKCAGLSGFKLTLQTGS